MNSLLRVTPRLIAKPVQRAAYTTEATSTTKKTGAIGGGWEFILFCFFSIKKNEMDDRIYWQFDEWTQFFIFFMFFFIWIKSFVGFLLGVTVAGSAGYYYLLEEYNNASGSLLSSVQELQGSTEKVNDDGLGFIYIVFVFCLFYLLPFLIFTIWMCFFLTIRSVNTLVRLNLLIRMSPSWRNWLLPPKNWMNWRLNSESFM